MADSMNSPLALELPLSREALASLRAGDACTLSGAMYTLRDAGHMRLLDELHERGCLPYDLEGATIFYAGPTPPAAGRPFGAVGRAWISPLLSCIGRVLPPRWARECAAKL